MVRFSSFVIILESRNSGRYFEFQIAGEFSLSQILLKLGVKMVRFSCFVIIHESRISFETQMAGEFSMSQILLKLGVKWPLVKAFQLHYFPA